MAEDLKNLPPEERIKRLKELEEKKKKEMEQGKKEIEEAERGIKNAQGELNEKRRVKEKVPIEEVAKEDGEGLSEEAKIILKTMMKNVGVREAVNEGVASDDEKKRDSKRDSTETSELERAVARDAARVSGSMNSPYVAQLSQQPMRNLYQEMTAVYDAVGEKGYMNSEEQKRVQYLASAVEKKIEDIEAGRYEVSSQVAQEALLTRQIGQNMGGMYTSNKGKKAKELDWYKSG